MEEDISKDYLECGLSSYLKESLEEYKVSLAKIESDQKDCRFDLYYDGVRRKIPSEIVFYLKHLNSYRRKGPLLKTNPKK